MKDIRSKPTCVVDHNNRDGEGEFIFWTSLIQITEINTNLDHPIFLGNRDNIGYPIGVLFLPDEVRVYELFDF